MMPCLKARLKVWCPYNRYDRYSSKRIQRSERLYGNRALSDRSIAMIAIATIAEIENVLFQRSRSLRSLSARFPYNRSDRGNFLSYRGDSSDYMDTRIKCLQSNSNYVEARI